MSAKLVWENQMDLLSTEIIKKNFPYIKLKLSSRLHLSKSLGEPLVPEFSGWLNMNVYGVTCLLGDPLCFEGNDQHWEYL
jgi:hypothetical protein